MGAGLPLFDSLVHSFCVAPRVALGLWGAHVTYTGPMGATYIFLTMVREVSGHDTHMH